jgi:hypothetical protein
MQLDIPSVDLSAVNTTCPITPIPRNFKFLTVSLTRIIRSFSVDCGVPTGREPGICSCGYEYEVWSIYGRIRPLIPRANNQVISSRVLLDNVTYFQLVAESAKNASIDRQHDRCGYCT